MQLQCNEFLGGEKTNGKPKHLPHWDEQRFTVQIQDNITSRQLDAKYMKSVLLYGSHAQIHPAKAGETKQIWFVSGRKVSIYNLKVGAQTPSTGGGPSTAIWHRGVE